MENIKVILFFLLFGLLTACPKSGQPTSKGTVNSNTPNTPSPTPDPAPTPVYNVIFITDGNTHISEGSSFKVSGEENLSIHITSSSGYSVNHEISGTCPAGLWSGDTYSTGIITGDCTASISSSANTYAVSIINDNNMTVSPGSQINVKHGGTHEFVVTPVSVGYLISNIVVGSCPVGSWQGNIYTTGVIISSCSVSFNSTIRDFSISLTSDANLNISPSVIPAVPFGGTQILLITPNSGYSVNSNVGGTCPFGSWLGSLYMTGFITNNCSMIFSSTINFANVTASGDSNLSFIPATPQLVQSGASLSFDVSSLFFGYSVSSIVSGNCPLGTWDQGKYTTGQILGDCKVVFSSAPTTYDLGGNIIGLDGTLTLLNNGANNLIVLTAGSFKFPIGLTNGATYNISILKQPLGQICTVTSGAGAMSTVAVSSININCVNVWSKTVEVGAAGGYTSGVATAVDSERNVFIAGNTSVGIDGLVNMGVSDFFLTKYDNKGKRVWTVQNGAPSASTYVKGIALDSAGNIYLCGYTNGAIDNHSLHGLEDYFITKYNSSGEKQWTVQAGAAAGSVNANAIAIDSNDNIFVVGTTNRAIDGQLLHGAWDLFLSKYNTSGIRQWTIEDGNGGNAAPISIAVDKSGTVIIGGYSNRTFHATGATGGNYHYIGKYNGSNGSWVWTKSFANITLGQIQVDGNGNIYGFGNTATSLSLTKINSAGITQWSVSNGPFNSTIFGLGLVISNAGDLYLTGTTEIGFQGQTLTGTRDYYLSKYNQSGTHLWTILNGVQGGSVLGNSVSADSDNNIYVVGTAYMGINGEVRLGLTDMFATQYSSSGVRR
jgi:hypothetical protein